MTNYHTLHALGPFHIVVNGKDYTLAEHILIDEGETFEGDFAMFSDSFFTLSHETADEKIAAILDWCVWYKCTFSYNGTILCRHGVA